MAFLDDYTLDSLQTHMSTSGGVTAHGKAGDRPEASHVCILGLKVREVGAREEGSAFKSGVGDGGS